MVKILQIGVGILLFVLGISGLVNGDIQGLGPHGIGDTIFRTEEPEKFWFTVFADFGGGALIIYYVLKTNK